MPHRNTHFYKLDAGSHSAIIKHSVVINGHKTSVSLEDIFWAALRHIALDRKITIAELVAMIDANRNGSTRSSAIRQFVVFDMQQCAHAGTSCDTAEIESPGIGNVSIPNSAAGNSDAENPSIENLTSTPKVAPID